MTNYEAIPKALAETPNWLCFNLVDTGKGRLGKPPVSPKTGQVCAKNDPTQFTTLTDALVGMEHHDLDGVGFVFTGGFLAIDLDDCFDEQGRLSDVAQDIFDHFSETYWEYSPSGNGLHGFMLADKPHNRTKDSALGIEVYNGFNFVTVTGDWVEGTGTDAIDMQDAVDWLYAEYLPPIITPNAELPPADHGTKTAAEWLALGLSKDEKLATLYNRTDHTGDESSTDFALLSKLAYWLNRDTDAMRDAFMASPWVSTKDKAHATKLKRADYLPDSITKAALLTSATAREGSASFETRAVRFFSLAPSGDGIPDFDIENYTDLGNALAMGEVFGDALCYTPEWGWCFFDGARWQTDVSYRAMEAAKDIATALMSTATEWVDRVRAELDDEGLAHDSDTGKARLAGAMALYKHAMKSQSEHGITAMCGLNKAYMISSAKLFNTDPWLLNTPRGVIDLKTGELMPHDAKYHLTQMTTLTPEVQDTPMFDKFLQQVFCGDVELIEFVQLVIGSSLVGKVYNENLIIANGTGANGKSTLFSTIHHLLGDYATAIDPDLLMSSKASEQQVGMAMLQSRRFAVAQETEEGQRLKSSMLKRLVSTDTMVAKRLYKDPHEFVPTHMLVLSTNHLPKVGSTDQGTWRRILVVPFEATIPPHEMITDFHSLLIEREGGGILRWAVEGAMKFYEMGCTINHRPAAVVRASAEYRSSEDWLAAFIDECCHKGEPHDETMVVRHSDLYRVYHGWAKSNGEYVRSSTALSKALVSAGWHTKPKWFDADRNTTAKVWFGLTLQDGGRTFTLIKGTANERKAQ